MDNVCVISANLGGFDKRSRHVHQSVGYNYVGFDDSNFPFRSKSITHRLQAKIPKCFGWKMVPGYEHYLWIDSNLTMTNPDTLKLFLDNCQKNDVVVLKHPKRNCIAREWEYVQKAMRQGSQYMVTRYTGEFMQEQVDEILSDKEYVDDFLVLGGIFMYKNTPIVQQVLKDWWYYISRYTIMDQFAWAYLLKKSRLKVKVLDVSFNDGVYIAHRAHIYHGR
jgi:hypothetical protein